jgi:NADH dehydrogenase
VLQAFEQAEAEQDPSRHQDLLTFFLVGAGPTGVELSAALAMRVRECGVAQIFSMNPTILFP